MTIKEEKDEREAPHSSCQRCGIKFPLESMLSRHILGQTSNYHIKKLFLHNMMKTSGKLMRKLTNIRNKRHHGNATHSARNFFLTHKYIKPKTGKLRENNYISCNSCGFKTSKKSKMILHMKNHDKKCETELNEFPFTKNRDTNTNIITSYIKFEDQTLVEKMCKCDLCDYVCTKKSTLYSHKRKHRLENNEEFHSCNDCTYKSKKKSSLYSHIWKKHKPTKISAAHVEMYSCSQCDYKNKNKYELKVHITRKHTDDYKFSCETCGKKFKVKGDLTNHIRFSHREQPVICDVCGKTCLNSNSLYVHQKFAHYKAKFECQVCKRRMVSQENLDEPMLRQHEKRENVVCEECGKTFSRNSRLKVHMRIHTGDKPYSCTICSKSFARRTALKQHLLIHTGVRPYVCDVCGKAFTQKPGLISHRKSHPGPHPPLPRVLIDHILNDVMNN